MQGNNILISTTTPSAKPTPTNPAYPTYSTDQDPFLPPGNGGEFDKKWTYEEYLEELKQPMVHPDPENPDDPLYYKKYAMNIAPPDVYYFLPPRYDTRAEDKKT